MAEVIRPEDLARACVVYESLRMSRPVTREDLRNYVKVFLGIDVPAVSICDGHSAPLDYLWHVYNSDFACLASGDCVVWANRGGGKTELAAAATLLDCVFKPGCSVTILGGSLEQSSRMYEYLGNFLHKGFEHLLAGEILKTRCEFKNGSAVEMLPQSDRSIRGRHVNKLRCDEVELFDPQVFSAAKFITQSTSSITAGMETISTMHRPFGLMQGLVADAKKNSTPTFKWCIWETIEKCTDRSCSRCALDADCRGRAKQACGYIRIDDVISQARRSSRAAFEAEMLCLKPSLEDVVFGEFDAAAHVAAVDYDPNLPLYRAIDFGFVNPFVCLWIQVDSAECVRVIDEYVRARASVDVHAAAIKERTPCAEEAVAATFCDPAGAGRNDVTGTSAVKELYRLGIKTRYRRSGIIEGVEYIRRALRTADGRVSFLVSPRCQRLIEAMVCYHYPESNSSSRGCELPFKDGVYDHPIDALRYFFAGWRCKVISRVVFY